MSLKFQAILIALGTGAQDEVVVKAGAATVK